MSALCAASACMRRTACSPACRDTILSWALCPGRAGPMRTCFPFWGSSFLPPRPGRSPRSAARRSGRCIAAPPSLAAICAPALKIHFICLTVAKSARTRRWSRLWCVTGAKPAVRSRALRKLAAHGSCRRALSRSQGAIGTSEPPGTCTIQLALAAIGATLQKRRPRRPGDDIGQRAAIAIAVIMLRVAKCHKRTIPLRHSGFRAPSKAPCKYHEEECREQSHAVSSQFRLPQHSSISR